MSFEQIQNQDDPHVNSDHLTAEEALQAAEKIEADRRLEVNPDPEGIREILGELGFIPPDEDMKEAA